MARPVRVLHLVGSAVDAFHADLSRLYARGCLDAVGDDPRYEHVVAHVAPGGAWSFPDGLSEAALAAAAPVAVGHALAHVAALEVDVMVPQMFCRPGMTAYRGLFDVLGVPYVGNPPDAMALTAHKPRARAVVAAAGVDVPAGEVLRRGQAPTLEPPVVVKPADADNSAGVALVREPGEYDDALAGAFAHADEVLVERYVELGREVRCGLIERGDELVVLPLEEYAVDEAAKPIRDAQDKLRPAAGGGLELVAKQRAYAWVVEDDPALTARVADVARTCHRALGCRDHSLFDLRIDPGGRPWFVEAGLYCSFSPQSVVAVMAAAAGITTGELFAAAIEQALRRREE